MKNLAVILARSGSKGLKDKDIRLLDGKPLMAYTIEAAEKAVISVCEAAHTPLWCNTLPEDNSLDGVIRKENNVRRQQAEKYYRINGAIYFVRVKKLWTDNDLYRKGNFAYIMERKRSIDIDTELDFLYAELIHRRLRGGILSSYQSLHNGICPHMGRCA